MKLYSLRLRAIGPFPGEHEVDFTALGRSGLFLLEGPTGAGKSTLIDAIVFALYGQLAGHDTSKQRLYSHHAESGVEPYVDLVFEVEAGVFRVRRTPSFERPKKRGNGTRTVNESVVLSRLTDVDRPDDGAVVVSTRAQEVGDEILHLVGLRRDQFLQTVVLPQGEFATFLRAPGEERKKLLQTIFRTDVYEHLTRELIERRKAASAQSAQARQSVDSAVHVLARVAEVDPDTMVAESLIADVVEERSKADAVAETARVAATAAEHAHRAAEEQAAALARRADLLVRRERWEAQREHIAQARERVSVARAASQILPYVRAERTAAQAQAATAERLSTAARAAPTDLDPADCARRSDALTESIHDLVDLQKLESTFEVREQQRVALDEQHLSLQAESVELERRRAARPLQRQSLTERRDLLIERLADRGVLEASVREAEARLEAADRVRAGQQELAQAQDLVKTLAGDASTAAHVHSELQLARIRGIAGELAEQLVVGEACVVCGSQSHPHPASRSTEHPDATALQHAEQRVARTTAALTEARAALDVSSQQIDFWRQQSGDLSVEQAADARDAAVQALDALREVAEQQRQLDHEIERLDTEATADGDARARLDTALATVAERRDQLVQSLAADRQRIEAALEPGTSLAEAVAALTAERAAVRALAEAASAASAAQERLVEAREILVEALTAAEFSGPDEVEAAALPITEIERLQHRIDAHRQEDALVTDGLAVPEIASLTGDERPDVEAALERRAAASDAHEAAVGLARVAARRHDQVVAAAEALREAEAALDSADADARTVTRLAGLADGTSVQNLKNLTLGTYVLLRRFEEVVAAANRRLAPMSDGRYHLRVSDERERSASGRRTGLALAMVDAETGREREPRTLSGGETFYVSLCLALGLADVVTAESGGVQLGTLFVDEGFGSLDAQTLDAVMAQLSGLARGGRTVGLVSHVEELKQRVADRISVTRLRDGSSTLTVVA